ncbi:alginate lyase family protein [Nevskia ramosa]|uniref:alginate lyase family protein n=1 Tax=Nevskia ramosa TaxID=64002 RepID=UPI00235691A8
MIRPQTADRSSQRWSADFRTNVAFVGGVPSAPPRSALQCIRAAIATAYNADSTAVVFGANVLRATNRGAVIEAPSRQLLSNGSLSRPVDDVPTGWRLNGATASNFVDGTYNGLPAIWLDVTVVNTTAAAITYRLDIEPTAGIPIPDIRQATFHGTAAIVSSTNAQTHEARLIPRFSSGSAASDQGRAQIPVGTPGPFRSAPAITAAAVQMGPAFTWLVAANSTSVTRLMVSGLMAEPGLVVSSFVPSFPPAETREQLHPNPTFAGVAAGTPGTLPTYVQPGTMPSYRVLAVNGDGSFDIEISGTAGGTDAIFNMPLNVAPPGGPAGLIPVAPGEIWEGSIYAQVLADDGGSPRMNLTARNSAGVAITGFNTSAGFTGTMSRVFRRFDPLPAGSAGLVIQLLLTVPAGTTRTSRLRLSTVHTDRITITPGSVSPDRPLDVVSFIEPSRFSGACEMTIEAELDSLVDGATLFAVTFASGHHLRLVAGPQVGVIVTMPGSPEYSALSPLYAAPGVIRLAVSWQAGKVSIGYSDACEGKSAELLAAGFDPTTAVGAWLGSDNGTNGLTTAVRIIDLLSGYTLPSDLVLRTRYRWYPRTFIQPHAGLRAPSIESVAPYAPPAVYVTGASYNHVPAGNRWVRRSNGGNGGVPMVDYFPLVSEVVVSEGAPFRLTIVNDDVVPLIMRTKPGAPQQIYPPPPTAELPYNLAPLPELVIPPGGRIFVCLDGYDQTTQLWKANNYNWWFVERSIDGLKPRYEFLSVYGPASELNPSRATVYPPYFCAYNADIGVPRQVSGAAVQAMNRGLFYNSPLDHARNIRFQRDAALSGYWAESVGSTTITQLKTQVCSMGFAYLGSRDAGVGSAADHALIREWFRDRTDQTVAFFTQNFETTARGNHGTAAGCAAAISAEILDRADYRRFAITIFTRAMEECAAIPGNTGSFLLEMRRGDKALQYTFLNLTYMLPLASSLKRAGFPAWTAFAGQLIKCVNFAMAALANPQLITDEQNRLIALGSPWSDGIIAAEQLPIGFSSTIDPISGDPLFNESRLAAIYIAYCELTTAQAPWRPAYQGAFILYDNIFNGSIGGGQSYLRKFPGITAPAPPPETV